MRTVESLCDTVITFYTAARVTCWPGWWRHSVWTWRQHRHTDEVSSDRRPHHGTLALRAWVRAAAAAAVTWTDWVRRRDLATTDCDDDSVSVNIATRRLSALRLMSGWTWFLSRPRLAASVSAHDARNKHHNSLPKSSAHKLSCLSIEKTTHLSLSRITNKNKGLPAIPVAWI